MTNFGDDENMDFPRILIVGAGISGLALARAQVDGDGLVTFADGSSGSYDLVVGADGIRSAVRRSAFSAGEPQFLNQVCWRFIVEGRPDISDWTVRTGSGGRAFLTVQLGGGRVYCYAESASTVATPPAGDWRSLFEGFADPVPDLLTQASDAYFAPLAEIAGSDWIRKNVVLIGDAAHACSPSMAQGGAMALEDVVVLAELLGTQPISQALPAYKGRRASRIEWVLEQNHRRDRARSLPTPLRNSLFRLAGKKLVKGNHAPLLSLP